MDWKQLENIISDHTKWLNCKGGQRADLKGANLQGADLGSRDLRSALLEGADLSGAELRYADLRCADLRNTNLRNANLGNADLRNARLDGAGILVLRLPIWTAFVHIDTVRIGCKHMTHREWLTAPDGQIAAMDPKALDWWHTHKPLIAAAINVVKSQGTI